MRAEAIKSPLHMIIAVCIGLGLLLVALIIGAVGPQEEIFQGYTAYAPDGDDSPLS